VIGRSGEGATKLKKELDMLLRTLKLSDKPEIKLDVEEVRSPESSASIVGQMIAEGLEKRLTFRRVMKQTIEKVMANRDVEGVRIILSGRLGGADMARRKNSRKVEFHYKPYALISTSLALLLVSRTERLVSRFGFTAVKYSLIETGRRNR
jgi:ribosomal protein S3